MTSDGRARGPAVLGALVVLAAAVAVVLAYRARTRREAPRAPASATAARPARRARPSRAHTHAPPGVVARAPAPAPSPGPAARPRAGAKFFAAWGSGPDQLGRTRPEEGDPMGPMSVAVDRRGRVYILDEINGRIVRRGADGKLDGTISLHQQTPEDIAVAGDGSIAVLDRHSGRNVALYDASGAPQGSLPLVGSGLTDPGDVTSILVDGNDVYAELEHNTLIKLGDTSGHVADPRTTLSGRPSRDGKSLLSARILDANAGRVRVTSVVRATGAVRFFRVLALVPVIHQILLLDTDLSGTIYFAVEFQRPGAVAVVTLSCLDPATGAVTGGALLPANTMPEESFRDFAVLDSGGVVYALRSPAGVTYQHYYCR